MTRTAVITAVLLVLFGAAAQADEIQFIDSGPAPFFYNPRWLSFGRETIAAQAVTTGSSATLTGLVMPLNCNAYILVTNSDPNGHPGSSVLTRTRVARDNLFVRGSRVIRVPPVAVAYNTELNVVVIAPDEVCNVDADLGSGHGATYLLEPGGDWRTVPWQGPYNSGELRMGVALLMKIEHADP